MEAFQCTMYKIGVFCLCVLISWIYFQKQIIEYALMTLNSPVDLFIVSHFWKTNKHFWWSNSMCNKLLIYTILTLYENASKNRRSDRKLRNINRIRYNINFYCIIIIIIHTRFNTIITIINECILNDQYIYFCSNWFEILKFPNLQ